MRTRRTSASSAPLVNRSRFSAESATSCGKLVILSAGWDCVSATGAIWARAEASAPARGEAAVRAGDCIEDTGEADIIGAGAVRGAPVAGRTGDAAPVCSHSL